MLYRKSILTAALLTTLSAVAQNANTPTPSQPNPQPATAPTVQAAASTTTEGPKLPVAAQLAPPRTMDEVVDRAIAREHALMAFLKDRTPLVETYLQNLKPDKELGAVPSEDHYFLGRMDMGENVDRRDYLAKQASLESTLLGGVTKLFKFEYHPMGFSWMVYADRWDFDRRAL